MKTWFTADLHFGHANIIRFCSRPFGSVEEMDACLIDNWNSCVARNDRVIVVGDFAYRIEERRLRAIFGKLNGQKALVIGNHDNAATLALPWAMPPRDILRIRVDDETVVACHYALRDWPGREAVHVYGHAHGTLPGNARSLDVGVDCWNYRPVTLAEVQARLVALPPDSDRDPNTSRPSL